MPLIGWAMLSAGGYPIVLWGGLHLPPIVPHTPALYAALRNAHSLLATCARNGADARGCGAVPPVGAA